MRDPTALGDEFADRLRQWYEKNRETWFERHHWNILGVDPDRYGTHADEWMLGFIQAYEQIKADVYKIEK
jgi:hypothetical protein